jgi:hypothetical protein
MSEETLCLQALNRHQSPKKTAAPNAPFTENSPQTAQLTPSPPTQKIDILIDLLQERERLKTIRQDVYTGKRKLSKNLSTDLFITQMIISSNKIALEALKETNITLTQNNNLSIDITNQTNELIKISREAACKPVALSTPS